MPGSRLLLPLLLCCAAGCGAAERHRTAESMDDDRKPPLLAFLGDSISEGYGLTAGEAFPARVAVLLAEHGVRVQLVNAGVSGDTSAGGLRRLPPLLARKPALLVVELGANDGLQGLSLGDLEANLRAIVGRARASGVPVLLLGMRIPAEYVSRRYADAFAALFPRLAAALSVPLVPAILDGIAGDPGLTLWDRLHPNAEGQREIARKVLPYVSELLGGRE